MKQFRYMIPFLLLTGHCYYTLVPVIQDTGSGMLILFFLLPFICFLSALLFGSYAINKERKKIQGKIAFMQPINSNEYLASFFVFAILTGAIFLPAVFWMLNFSALIYCVLYAGAAFVGCFVGNLLGYQDRS